MIIDHNYILFKVMLANYKEVNYEVRSLNNHIMQTSNELWRCVYCGVLFQSKIKLKSHFSEHNSEKLDFYADKCSCSCGKYFSKFHYFENHLLQSGHMNNSNIILFGSPSSPTRSPLIISNHNQMYSPYSRSPQQMSQIMTSSSDNDIIIQKNHPTNGNNGNNAALYSHSFHSSNIVTKKEFGTVYISGTTIESCSLGMFALCTNLLYTFTHTLTYTLHYSHCHYSWLCLAYNGSIGRFNHTRGCVTLSHT